MPSLETVSPELIWETRRTAIVFSVLVLLAPVVFLPFALFYATRTARLAGIGLAILPFALAVTFGLVLLIVTLILH